MNLSIYPEPKLNVLRSNGTISLDEVTDDHGNSLLPQGNGTPRMWSGFAGGGFGGWTLYAPLHYPKQNIGAKIVKFKGSTSFVVQTESQKIELNDLASLKETSRIIYGMQVTFAEMTKAKDNWQLRVHVAQPNYSGPEWQQLIEGLQARMQVQDADGNPLDHRGMSTNSNNAAVDMTLDFGRATRPDGRRGGEPARLVWEVPTRTRELAVPIELTDIPLFDDK
jgi:hypothetical protein